MGVCQTKIPIKNQSPFEIDEKSFEILDLVGIGGFAKVFKVRYKFNQKIYAMKIQSKLKIIKKKQTRSVLKEREILGELLHAWYLVNMLLAFQDQENLYIIMDFLQGGNLRSYILKRQAVILPNQPVFNHEQACNNRQDSESSSRRVPSSLSTTSTIVTSSIGTSNPRISSSMILATSEWLTSEQRSSTVETTRMIQVDTYQIVAPEVVCMQNHSFAVDYFALGVILYEIAMNHRPYQGLDKYEIREQYLMGQVQITRDRAPYGWSIESIDFINQLIQRKPNDRLPTQQHNELKHHPWLKEFPWQQLELQLLASPLMSVVADTSKTKENQMMQQQLANEEEDAWDHTTGKELLQNQRFQDLFENYEYNSYMLPFPDQIKYAK